MWLYSCKKHKNAILISFESFEFSKPPAGFIKVRISLLIRMTVTSDKYTCTYKYTYAKETCTETPI